MVRAGFVLVGWEAVKAAILSIPSDNIFNEFLMMVFVVKAFVIVLRAGGLVTI